MICLSSKNLFSYFEPISRLFYDKISLMKFRVLLSIFFVIATILSATHELEHITQDDTSSCMVYHINDKLTSVDIIDENKVVELFHFENIQHNNQILTLHRKDKSNPNRAPPLVS